MGVAVGILFLVCLEAEIPLGDASTKNIAYTDTNDKQGIQCSLFFDAIAKNIELGCKNLGTEQYFRKHLGSEACKIKIFNNGVHILYLLQTVKNLVLALI